MESGAKKRKLGIDVSWEQMDILLGFMSQHMGLSKTEKDTAAISPLSNDQRDVLWDELVQRLNSTGPAVKSKTDWQDMWEMWSNQLCDAKKKAEANGETTGVASDSVTVTRQDETTVVTVFRPEAAQGNSRSVLQRLASQTQVFLPCTTVVGGGSPTATVPTIAVAPMSAKASPDTSKVVPAVKEEKTMYLLVGPNTTQAGRIPTLSGPQVLVPCNALGKGAGPSTAPNNLGMGSSGPSFVLGAPANPCFSGATYLDPGLSRRLLPKPPSQILDSQAAPGSFFVPSSSLDGGGTLFVQVPKVEQQKESDNSKKGSGRSSTEQGGRARDGQQGDDVALQMIECQRRLVEVTETRLASEEKFFRQMLEHQIQANARQERQTAALIMALTHQAEAARQQAQAARQEVELSRRQLEASRQQAALLLLMVLCTTIFRQNTLSQPK